MVKLTQEIPARMRVRGQMDETGELTLTVQVSAPYGQPIDEKAMTPECSVRYEAKVPPDLVGPLKAALEKIRAYTLEHCAVDLQRAIFISRETGLRLGEIKEG